MFIEDMKKNKLFSNILTFDVIIYLNHLIEEHIWKIKILKTSYYFIMIGIATNDFDINRASYDTNNNFGWYYHCCTGVLYSGPPHNYQNKETNLKSKKK